MAFGLKKSDSAVVPQGEQPAVPAPIVRAPRSKGSSVGFADVALIVTAVVLLAAIGSQFLAMKAMFVF